MQWTPNRWVWGGGLMLLVAASAYFAGRARAAGIPQTGTLSYTGTLLSFGQANNGQHTISVALVAPDSTDTCGTSPAMVQVTNGRFTVTLPPSCVELVHTHPDAQVQVTVDGTTLGATPLTAVPYAVEADTATNAAPGSPLSMLVPPGSVMAYMGTTPPPGWFLCNGQAVSRTTYAGLFAVLGTASGAGDGSTTFNLPDMRGYFLRGLDQGAGRDPDVGSRTALAAGGNTGDAVSSVQGDEIQSHTHGLTDPGHNHGGGTGGVAGFNGTNGWRDYTGTGANCRGFQYINQQICSNDFASHSHTIPTGTTGISIHNAGGNETRPANVAVNYIIKY